MVALLIVLAVHIILMFVLTLYARKYQLGEANPYLFAFPILGPILFFVALLVALAYKKEFEKKNSSNK